MTSIVVPALCGAATGAIAYGGYKLLETLNTGHYATTPWDCPRLCNDLQTTYKSGVKENRKKTDSNHTQSKEKKRSPGNLQTQIEQGKAPKSIDRADKGRGEYEKDHIHFNDGSALNQDGTWKHGGKELTRQEVEWLYKNGWNSP